MSTSVFLAVAYVCGTVSGFVLYAKTGAAVAAYLTFFSFLLLLVVFVQMVFG